MNEHRRSIPPEAVGAELALDLIIGRDGKDLDQSTNNTNERTALKSLEKINHPRYNAARVNNFHLYILDLRFQETD